MTILLTILSFLWSGAQKVFAALFSFFSKPPGIYVLALLLVSGAVWLSGQRGYERGVSNTLQQVKLAQAEAEAKALALGMQRQFALDKGMAAAADKAGFLRGQAQARTITLTKEVTKYVTVETDREYPLPCGLIRMHDAAALGVEAAALDNPSGLADGEACPVKASDLAGVIIENYGIDHQKDAQIMGLQDLARTLAAEVSGVSNGKAQ